MRPTVAHRVPVEMPAYAAANMRPSCANGATEERRFEPSDGRRPLSLLTGWGRTAATAAGLVRLERPGDAADALASPPERGVIARGSGAATGTRPRTRRSGPRRDGARPHPGR